MKNKHIVFLFLGVLALGLATRWLPVQYQSLLETHLLRIKTSEVSRVVVSSAGKPDLLLDRIEAGWSVEQEGRSTVTAMDTILRLLDALSGIGTFEVIKTSSPDTLGFAQGNLLRIRLYHQNNLLENIEIGDECLLPKGGFTYLRLPTHAGIYRVPGLFRRMFNRTLDDFRSKILIDFLPNAVSTIDGHGVGAYYLTKVDSAWFLTTSCGRVEQHPDSVRMLLLMLESLNGSPFADYFDESQEKQTLLATLVLKGNFAPATTLRFFALTPPDLPEDVTGLRRRGIHTLPAYVVHSSTNPLNYFAVADSHLVRRIFLAAFDSSK